jgi:hypothetical protein
MRLALGIVFLWLGALFISLAAHGLQASTPWGAYQTVIAKLREGAGDGESATPGAG